MFINMKHTLPCLFNQPATRDVDMIELYRREARQKNKLGYLLRYSAVW